ncbi:MAG: hypothetical protein ACEPOV_12525 [Hyphomicrobiales bacterium]
MKRILFILLIIGAFSCNQSTSNQKNTTPQEQAALTPNDGVLVHITHGAEDPQYPIMGLIMAKNMMIKKKDVLVYLDIRGIEMVLKEGSKIEFKGHTPGKYLQELISNNIPVVVCPGCLMAMDKTPEDLIEGVVLKDEEQFFNFTKGRIVTFDY